MSTHNNNKITVMCANILDFVDDPAIAGENAHRYFEKGALVIQNGKVVNLGYEQDILPQKKNVGCSPFFTIALQATSGALIPV